MEKIPVKFKRVAAEFEQAARQRRPCETNSSEYRSAEEEEDGDLSELVNSFIDGDDEETNLIENERRKEVEENDDGSDGGMKELLLSLVGGDGGSGSGGRVLERRIRDEIEVGCRVIAENCTRNGFKRQLMAYLREKGYDAGLCKSRWGKTGRRPAGDYEYIDVNAAGTRYIAEVFLAGEFQIARPTARYTSLVDMLPSVFFGSEEELKQIVSLMSAAVKQSLKSVELHVPPWRRSWYMQAKWFGPYKRTTHPVPEKIPRDGSPTNKRSVGFEASPAISYNCREDFAGNAGFRTGLLAAALQGK
ncbi:hypothetical protein Nepgr_007103 [Nepenthes gracilis]|uniref:DUF506 family protein n=1 Tax=Nepenthes gracilis TaxID=150966 RepID=A0AAD3XHZ5_NEPGR|nr:hypothetical protein Nepgr_007103 [Nepenthes gracilis]